MWRSCREVSGMDTQNTSDSKSGRRSTSGGQLRTAIDPGLGSEVTQRLTTHGLYPSFPSTAEPHNIPIHMRSTPASMPHLPKAFQTNNTSPRRSSSENQLYGLTGTAHPTSPRHTPSSGAMRGGSEYGYADFPWSDEPQTMSMPSPSIPKSTRDSGMDGKTAPRNRKKPSGSTLTDRGRMGIQCSSGYRNASFSSAAGSQNIPMPTLSTQPRPYPSRRLSEYTAMVLAVDEIPVGLSSILFNANGLSLRLRKYTIYS